jgi:exonuclease VII small subunit
MEMSFDRAVEIVKNYASNGSLLDGLEEIHTALEEGDAPLTEAMAYHTVTREMYSLFF